MTENTLPNELPFRLNLEQQRKRAKELQKALLAGNPVALLRFRQHHPRGQALPDAAADRLTDLSEAQLVIAREIGLPSWAKLKAHILAMQQARESIAGAAGPLDRDTKTLHVRCGSDLKSPLESAGFSGDFLEYSDPLCQGPVVAGEEWIDLRASFLAGAYGAATRRTKEQIRQVLERAEQDLRSAAEQYERVVLWFEHDSHDQLILARCLTQFAETPPRRLELISVNQYPGAARFIGLGQLPPEALRLLWDQRRLVSKQQLSASQSVWTYLRSPDPTALAALGSSTMPDLPYLSEAIRRHCQELPWLHDGLGLTERLVLRLVDERPRTMSEIFRDLMTEREPLPWLGDIMFRFIVDTMKLAERPVFTGAFEGEARDWPAERLTITPLGQAVLAGDVDWLSLSPPERWLGGVHIRAGQPCWRWDEDAATTMLR